MNNPNPELYISQRWGNAEFVKEYDKKRTHRRINFKGKIIRLGFVPRIGICSKCGKKGKTDLHHEEYDSNNILANTIELCDSCHSKETTKHRIRDKLGRFI